MNPLNPPVNIFSPEKSKIGCLICVSPKITYNTIVIKRIVDSILLTLAKISIPSRFRTNRIITPIIAIVLTVIFGRRLLMYNPNARAKELFKIGVTNFV